MVLGLAQCAAGAVDTSTSTLQGALSLVHSCNLPAKYALMVMRRLAYVQVGSKKTVCTTYT